MVAHLHCRGIMLTCFCRHSMYCCNTNVFASTGFGFSKYTYVYLCNASNATNVTLLECSEIFQNTVPFFCAGNSNVAELHGQVAHVITNTPGRTSSTTQATITTNPTRNTTPSIKQGCVTLSHAHEN